MEAKNIFYGESEIGDPDRDTLIRANFDAGFLW